MPSRRASAALASALVAAVLVVPAGVPAQEPPDPPDEPVERRTYRGETSQDRTVTVTTGSDGLVDRVRIDWVATCRRERFRYRTRTVDTPPFDAVSPTRVRDEYVYVERSRGGVRARVAATLSARRSGSGARRRWSGTFSARVVVRRDGRRVDACRTTRPVRWNAALVRASG